MAEVTNVKEDQKAGLRTFTIKHDGKNHEYAVPLSFSQEATDASVAGQIAALEHETDGADNTPQEAASADKSDYSPEALKQRTDAAEAVRAKAQRESAEHPTDDDQE